MAEKYRIEGNTLIINDGVTAIEGADFHTYDESGLEYEDLKDEKFRNVKKVVLPDSVTEIDYDAFYEFQSLKDISLPNSITNISDYAFAYCSSLESVTIPSNATNIGYDAFFGCANLTNITISNGVTSIGNFAFSICEELKSIIIPNSVEEIGEDAFLGCDNLTIKCNKGSYAEKYAEENNIPIELIDDKIYHIEGDTLIINDGVITIEGKDFHIYDEDEVEDWLDYSSLKEELENIKKVIVPDSVTDIGYGAFCEFESLEDVSLPNGIEHISSYAFWNCKSLKNITIPDGVTDIETSAFLNCESLTSITLPNSVTLISDYAFQNCKNLTNITIPTTEIPHIYDAAFDECENLTITCSKGSYVEVFAKKHNIPVEYIEKYHIKDDTLIVNDGITAIDVDDFHYEEWDEGIPRVFDDIKDIQHIIVPESVKKIGAYSFGEFHNLKSVELPDTLDSVDTTRLFSGSFNLGKVRIPNGVKTLKEWTFAGCKNLTIEVPHFSIEDIDSDAFDGIDNLTIKCVKGSYIAEYAKENDIPVEFIDDKIYHIESDTLIINDGIVAIDADDFHIYDEDDCLLIKQELKNIKKVIVPDSVKNIGISAFYECDNLESIIIPNGVTNISDYTFNDCFNLTNITIPDSVTSIGIGAFRDCSSLTSITIPDSVTNIGEHAFDECKSLTNITIPDSVTSIGEFAFSECTSLTSINIPNSVTNIGYCAFFSCKNLKNITIPDSVTTIGDGTFAECTSLTSITIPDSVTSIGDDAFEDCKSLTNITIPNSVTSIGKKTFRGCENLTSIIIPDSVKCIGNCAFYRCENLTSITIPDSVTSIVGYAFEDCKSLTITCNKGSYAEEYAKENNIPVEYIDEHIKDEHIKEQALSQIKDYINTLAEAMKHYDGKGDVNTYLEGYVGSSGADLGAFLSETSAAYIRNCFVSAYSGVDFNYTEDKSPTERYETRISSAVDKATSLAEELVNKSEKTSVKEIVDDVMQNEDFKNILKNELNAENDYYFSQEDYDNRLDSYTEEYNEIKAEILENYKDDIDNGKMSEQDINELIGADMNTYYPVKEECVVYIRDIKDTILENGAGTLTLDDFGDKHYNVQIESDSEIYTFKVSLPVSKTVGGVKVQGFKELGYIDVGKDEIEKTLKGIAENTVIISSKEYGSKPLNELLEKNSKAKER